VVGNGPSLNKSNLDLLAHADVIVSNFALLSPSLREHATILTVVNDLVARQGCVDFNAVTIPKVLPFWLANSVNPTPETVFVKATVRPEFNEILSGEYSWRSTVSFFNMQLAFALGYEKVLLIGFDHFYKQPSKVREGDRLDQDEEDLNHFDPRYFKGKTWQAADTDNMEASYNLAKHAYAGAGRTILNCTVGGRLEIFPRASLGEELRGARKNPSVRVSLPYGRGVNEVSPLTEALDDLLSSQRATRDSILSALGSRSVKGRHGLPVKSQDVV
jgi:hypothetical protein